MDNKNIVEIACKNSPKFEPYILNEGKYEKLKVNEGDKTLSKAKFLLRLSV